jgi:hypothetical protein
VCGGEGERKLRDFAPNHANPVRNPLEKHSI